MSSELGYYRQPTISGDTIVFTAEDDLWSVSSDGGTARRLTANPGISSFPVFSPDRASIAFTGRDDGPAEVYVMDAQGGEARRLTWMGARTQVVGWSRDGKEVIAATDWQQPFDGVVHLVAVGRNGGAPRRLHVGPARAVSFSPVSDGVVIGRNSGDPARWKRYRGGTAGTLWVDRGGNGRFVPLATLEGNLASPMWIGARIYFLSDHEGHGNLYSCTPTGRDLRGHTTHDDFYVRFPTTDGRRIVYHAGADIYVFDTDQGAATKLDVGIHSTQSQRNRKFVSAGRYLESFDLHPKGHSIASVHRGGLFSMGLWEGAPIRMGAVSATRYRLATWLPDGERIVAVHDEGGEESFVVFRCDGSQAPKTIRGDFGRPLDLYVAPGAIHDEAEKEEEDGKKKSKKKKGKTRTKKTTANLVALTNHRQELILVDLDNGSSRVIDRSRHHRISGVAWSPDSDWLAYGSSAADSTGAIRLCKVESGEITTITREDFFDGFPSFDPAGRYLYFVSWRVFNPVYDSLYFDLGFPKGGRPYLVSLRKNIASPFAEATRPLRAPGAPAEAKENSNDDRAQVEIDLDGIAERVVAFPVQEGRYGRIYAAENRALFSRYPVEGSLDEAEDTSAPGILEFWDFEKNKLGRVSDKVTDFQLSLDLKVLGIRSGSSIRVLPAAFKEDPDKNKDEYSRETGWINLERLPVSVVPTDEWRQMYDEAWRLQREHFWTPDMSGINWEEVRERYRPLLGRVGSRAEFSDLMWEMQGELGTSHCYEMGGDYRPRPNWRQGFLGVDLELHRGRRWRVVRIPEGDSWVHEYASPLAAPGVNVKPGDEILAVGGEPVDGNVSPFERLVNLADTQVRVTIMRRGRGRGSKTPETLALTTLRDETPLRYRDWVENNKRRVHDDTGGRVGYVHIPDMGAFGYSEFHRYYARESERDALVIDVRYNRGGHVSELLLEKLLRRRIGYDIPRWGEPMPYPRASPMGPMVALTNEYAGSDGDIFCHAFKLFGLGPLIGKRTWGGVIGIWPRAALVDGTITTQPEYASWFEDVGYGVENYGTDPDIEVDIRPQDYVEGRDRQLERALREVRRILRRNRPKKPDLRGRPGSP